MTKGCQSSNPQYPSLVEVEQNTLEMDCLINYHNWTGILADHRKTGEVIFECCSGEYFYHRGKNNHALTRARRKGNPLLDSSLHRAFFVQSINDGKMYLGYIDIRRRFQVVPVPRTRPDRIDWEGVQKIADVALGIFKDSMETIESLTISARRLGLGPEETNLITREVITRAMEVDMWSMSKKAKKTRNQSLWQWFIDVAKSWPGGKS